MKNENDDAVRILVVSNNDLIKEDTFDNSGINADFVHARSLLDAMYQLDEWAKEGISADIVDIEHYPPFLPMRETTTEEYNQCEAFKEHFGGEDYTGVEAVKFFNDWSNQHQEDLQIGKFFINTLFPRDFSEEDISEELGVPVDTHHILEYGAMRSYSEYGRVSTLDISSSMREYLNEEFGANYPVVGNPSQKEDLAM